MHRCVCVCVRAEEGRGRKFWAGERERGGGGGGWPALVRGAHLGHRFEWRAGRGRTHTTHTHTHTHRHGVSRILRVTRRSFRGRVTSGSRVYIIYIYLIVYIYSNLIWWALAAVSLARHHLRAIAVSIAVSRDSAEIFQPLFGSRPTNIFRPGFPT